MFNTPYPEEFIVKLSLWIQYLCSGAGLDFARINNTTAAGQNLRH
jgi:hypothetical protein